MIASRGILTNVNPKPGLPSLAACRAAGAKAVADGELARQQYIRKYPGYVTQYGFDVHWTCTSDDGKRVVRGPES
jgi:hypothetical protein